MGLSQKDAVPFLLYSIEFASGDGSKKSSGTFCNFIRNILQNHQEHFAKSLRRFFRLLKIFPRKHQQKMFLRY